MEQSYEDYCAEVEAEATAEFLANDPVHQNFRYHEFVSRSKGWRNGKQRLRCPPKEVCLLSYRDRGFHQAHRFPFDVDATETFGSSVKPDEAEEKLRELIPLRAQRG